MLVLIKEKSIICNDMMLTGKDLVKYLKGE